MPKILKDLSAFVRNHKNLPLSIGGVDGRMDSALSEERIISLLLDIDVLYPLSVIFLDKTRRVTRQNIRF